MRQGRLNQLLDEMAEEGITDEQRHQILVTLAEIPRETPMQDDIRYLNPPQYLKLVKTRLLEMEYRQRRPYEEIVDYVIETLSDTLHRHSHLEGLIQWEKTKAFEDYLQSRDNLNEVLTKAGEIKAYKATTLGNIAIPSGVDTIKEFLEDMRKTSNAMLEMVAPKQNMTVTLTELDELRKQASRNEMATLQVCMMYDEMRDPRYLASEMIKRLEQGADAIIIVHFLRYINKTDLQKLPDKPKYKNHETDLWRLAEGLVEAVKQRKSDMGIEKYARANKMDRGTVAKYGQWLVFFEEMAKVVPEKPKWGNNGEINPK